MTKLRKDSKPTPINNDLYKKARKMADKIYNRPSAYKSGYIVKKYKELGGRYTGNRNQSSLKRWFDEQWRDINPFKTETSYPVYRPTKRVSPKTPLTFNEIDYNDLLKKSKIKQKYKNRIILEPFKKKNKPKKFIEKY
jgi:hypothetical protein